MVHRVYTPFQPFYLKIDIFIFSKRYILAFILYIIQLILFKLKSNHLISNYLSKN